MKMVVTFDPKSTDEKIKKAVKKCQETLDAQVLKDSNFYAPFRSKTLIQKSVADNKAGTGHVDWNVSYAETQYYHYPNKLKIHNPKASMKWFELAKANKMQQWEKLVNDTFDKNYK